jgi:hypothetical protein
MGITIKESHENYRGKGGKHMPKPPEQENEEQHNRSQAALRHEK